MTMDTRPYKTWRNTQDTLVFVLRDEVRGMSLACDGE
jgi:hypothetical protein